MANSVGFIVGIIAGFINTMAGGGSILSLPMLIIHGSANGCGDNNRWRLQFRAYVQLPVLKEKASRILNQASSWQYQHL
jgi:hypothetical protein